MDVFGTINNSMSCYYCLVTKPCPTLLGPNGLYSLPGSSVHGISQATILEWVAISFSRGSSQPRNQTCVSCIGRWILYHWDTREDHIYTYIYIYVHTHTHSFYYNSYICMYVSTYLSPLVLKADKSQDLHTNSASWRPRRANDLVSVSV